MEEGGEVEEAVGEVEEEVAGAAEGVEVAVDHQVIKKSEIRTIFSTD